MMGARHVRLDSPRLVIRSVRRGDARALADFVARNRTFHAPWDPSRSEEFFTPAGQRAVIRRTRRASDVVFLLARRERDPRGPIVAVVGFSGIMMGPFRSCFLGYRVDGAHAGTGMMRETLVASLDWAFSRLGLHRVEANIMPRNARSVGLARSLGFRLEGRAHALLEIAGAWEDHDRYALLDREWAAVDRTR